MIKGNSVVQSRNYSDGNVSRTKVRRNFDWRSTFSSGFLVPFYGEEVYPGQFKSIDFGELIRSITPLGPTMDNAYLDVFFFFVPMRLVWDHWEEFIAGYNKEAWTQDVVYQVPQIKFKDFETYYHNFGTEGEPIDGIQINYHSIGNNTYQKTYDSKTYFLKADGYQTVLNNIFVHSWMDYLPGYTDPVNLLKDTMGVDYDGDYATASMLGCYSVSALYPRAYVKIWNDWFRDENLQDELELYTGDNDEYADEFAFNLLDPQAIPKAAKYHNRFTSALPGPQKGPDVLIPMSDLPVGIVSPNSSAGLSSNHFAGFQAGQALVEGFNQYKDMTSSAYTGPAVVANNVSNTIRMLRLATQTELLLARDARGGTRYVESLLSHFGVHNGDARLQRSEYLGSQQIPLQVMQVTNTAGTSSDALGNVGGQSVTRHNGHYFSKAFTEHGIVLGVMTIRTNISYSSGIRKQFKRKDRFDFIWPEFKHIGDVPLYTDELYIGGESFLNNNINSRLVFGYTPYGSELREGYNFNNGLFREAVDGSLSYLTYQEHYEGDSDGTILPTLSDEWIQQSDVIRNTLIDQSGPEYYGLFKLVSEDVIPLDPTSDPGLMDHF